MLKNGKKGIIEYQAKRREAVAKNLARLAFVVSDVIIFIWNESFANHSYLERVKKLVHQSTDQIDSAYAPSLILIHNKASLGLSSSFYFSFYFLFNIPYYLLFIIPYYFLFNIPYYFLFNIPYYFLFIISLHFISYLFIIIIY